MGVTHAEQPGRPADVLVNATSLGLHGEDLPAELGPEPAGVVLDLVYGDGAHRAVPLGRCRKGRGWWRGSRCWSARAPAASSGGPDAPLRSTRCAARPAPSRPGSLPLNPVPAVADMPRQWRSPAPSSSPFWGLPCSAPPFSPCRAHATPRATTPPRRRSRSSRPSRPPPRQSRRPRLRARRSCSRVPSRAARSTAQPSPPRCLQRPGTARQPRPLGGLRAGRRKRRAAVRARCQGERGRRARRGRLRVARRRGVLHAGRHRLARARRAVEPRRGGRRQRRRCAAAEHSASDRPAELGDAAWSPRAPRPSTASRRTTSPPRSIPSGSCATRWPPCARPGSRCRAPEQSRRP